MSRLLATILGPVLLTAVGCLLPEPTPVYRATPRTEAVAATPGRPARHILALSGGGSYGAFTAGLLTGWTRTNDRPQFDVVTGVSTGALIAPLAFLGPEYDVLMRKFYTEVEQHDIITPYYWAEVPLRSSIASSAPLRAILETGITPEVIAEIAAAHRDGRRLYVATTQIDTKKTVVWDVGEIANGPDGRRFVIEVLLASCAVPGIFPPVQLPETSESRGRWHVDGGVTSPVVMPGFVLERAAPGAKLYCVVAGKLYPDTLPVPPRVTKILSASGAAIMHSLTRQEVTNLAQLARLNDVGFHAASIRSDFKIRETGIEFNANSMNRMYTEGVTVGLAGPKWDAELPTGGPAGAPEQVRTGVR